MRIEHKIEKENYYLCIVIEIYITFFAGNITYSIKDVGIKTKGQRKYRFKCSNITEDYKYRKLDMDGRNEYIKKIIMTYATDEDIKKALEYAYEQIKPNLNNIQFKC